MKKNLLIILIGTLILTVAILGTYFGYRYYLKTLPASAKVLAVVGDKKITQKDLNEMIYGIDFQGSVDKPEAKVSKEEKESFLNKLVEETIMEIKAQELNISAPEEEIKAEIKKRKADYDSLANLHKDLVHKRVKSELLTEKVKEAILDYKEGKYLLFRFDKYFKDNEKILGMKVNDEMVQKQREYAEKFSKAISESLSKKELTFEGALQILIKDPQLSAKAFRPITPNIYGQFTKFDFQQNLGMFTSSYQGLKEKIISLKEGEISEPFVIKRLVDKDFKEFAFVLVKIEKTGKGEFVSYEEWLQEQRKNLKVKIYYNKIGFKFELKPQTTYAKVSIAEASPYCSPAGSERTNIITYLYYRGADGGTYAYDGVTLLQASGSWYKDRQGLYNCSTGGFQYAVEFGSDSSGTADLGANELNHYCPRTAWSYVFFPKYGSRNGNTKGIDGYWADLGGSGWAAYYGSDLYGALGTGYESPLASNSPIKGLIDAYYSHVLIYNLGSPSNWANGTTVWHSALWVPTWPPTYMAKLYVDETPISGHNVTSTTGHGGTTPYSINILQSTIVNLTAPDPYIAGGKEYTFYQWRITGPGIAVAPDPAKKDTNKTINISIEEGNYFAIADFQGKALALPSSSLNCAGATNDSISLEYDVTEAFDAGITQIGLYRDGSLITTLKKYEKISKIWWDPINKWWVPYSYYKYYDSKGSYTDTGLTQDKTYTYELKSEIATIWNGMYIGKGTTLASTSCTTGYPASGNLFNCSSSTDSIIFNYSFTYSKSNKVSLFRGNNRLITFSGLSGSGSYTDSSLYPGTSYTYYLRDGDSTSSPLLASLDCTTLPTGAGIPGAPGWTPIWREVIPQLFILPFIY